jgi:hypothetical protein
VAGKKYCEKYFNKKANKWITKPDSKSQLDMLSLVFTFLDFEVRMSPFKYSKLCRQVRLFVLFFLCVCYSYFIFSPFYFPRRFALICCVFKNTLACPRNTLFMPLTSTLLVAFS